MVVMTAVMKLRFLPEAMNTHNFPKQSKSVCLLHHRERLLIIIPAGESEEGFDFITTTTSGLRVAAPDIVGIWNNNRVPNVSVELKKNVVGVLSQVCSKQQTLLSNRR